MNARMRDVPAPLVPSRAAAAAVASNAATLEGAPRSPPTPQPAAEVVVSSGQNLSSLGGVSRVGTRATMGSPSAPSTPAPTRRMLSAQSSKRSYVNTPAARGFLSSKHRRKTGELARAAALTGAAARASGTPRIPLAAPSAASPASADTNISPPPQQQQHMPQQQSLASPVSSGSNTITQQHRHGAHDSAPLLTARGSRVAAKGAMEAKPPAPIMAALGGGGKSNTDDASRCHPNITPTSTHRLPIASVQQTCPSGLPSALGPLYSAKQEVQDSRIPQSQPIPTPISTNSRRGSNNTAAAAAMTSGEDSLPSAHPYTCSGRTFVAQPRSEHWGKEVSSSVRARGGYAVVTRGSGGGVGNISCDNQVPTSAPLSSSPTFPTPLPPSSPRVAALGETHSSANSGTGSSTNTGVSSAPASARRRRRGQPQQQQQVQVPFPAPPLPSLTTEAFANLSQALAQSPSPPSWPSGKKFGEPWVDEAKRAAGVQSKALVDGALSKAAVEDREIGSGEGRENGEGVVADVGGAGVVATEDTDMWAMSPSEGLEDGEPGERGVAGVGGGIAVRASDDGARAEVVERARKTGEANIVLVMEEKEVRDF